MKFVIKKVSEVEAIRRRLPTVVEIEGELEDSDFRVFLSKQARIFLVGSYNLGQNLLMRENERGGVLLGNLYYDTVDGRRITYTAVTDIVPAEEAEAGYTHVEFDGQVLSAVMEEAQNYIRQTGENLRIVGWYHTHPGFGVFMSGTDQQTQRQIYGTDWHVAIVFDPIRRDYGIFYGRDSTPCRGWYIFDMLAEGFAPPLVLRLRFDQYEGYSRKADEDFIKLKQTLLEEFHEMFDPIKDAF